MMFFDMILDHEEEKAKIQKLGWGCFLDRLKEQHPEKKLYSVTQDWYHDSRFICKVRGQNGDLVIGWKGEHQEE